MESQRSKIFSVIGRHHYAPGIWCVMLLLSLESAIFGKGWQTELSDTLGGIFTCTPWVTTAIVYLAYLLATILSCWLLLRLNNAYSLIQQRTALPSTLLVFFNGCVPSFANTPNIGIWLSPLFVGLLYLLYSTYQSPGRETPYSIGLLIMIGALIWPPFIALLLPFLVGLIYMRAITWRTITAMLLGVLTPVWLFFCVYFLFDLDPPYSIADFTAIFVPDEIAVSPWSIKNIGFFIALVIVGISCCISISYIISWYKIQTWYSNRFLALLFAVLLIICLLNPLSLTSCLPLLHILLAQAIGYYLTHAQNRFLLWQAGIVIAIYLFLYIWNF